MSTPDPIALRQSIVTDAKLIVVKVGSRLLADVDNATREQRIEQLVEQIAMIRKQQVDVLLVTSGAIGAGIQMTKQKKRPNDLALLQALAAIGQSRLMSLYEQASASHGFHCGQILLSADDVKDRKRHLNIRNCLTSLLNNGALPIINENDTVSVDEICFGDNDRLAALVATMVRADLTILLTTVDGFHTRVGAEMGERISVIDAMTDEIRSMAGGTDDATFSKGGMSSKLDAAEISMTSGEALWIADGRDFGILQRIMKAEDVGTLFHSASHNRMTGSKRFLAFFSDPAGSITIDSGAVKALTQKGKSLLPSGITDISDDFEKGDTIEITDPHGHVIGLGVTNYSAEMLRQVKGLRTIDISTTLKRDGYSVAIHRNNMVIFDS